MSILLDTHTFLWFIGGNPILPAPIRNYLTDPSVPRFLSIASLWEMAIKVNAGKLALGMSFPTLIQHHVLGNGIKILEIKADHLERFAQLPIHHRDPFDRMIIAQAIAENIPVISRDSAFDQYDVARRWER